MSLGVEFLELFLPFAIVSQYFGWHSVLSKSRSFPMDSSGVRGFRLLVGQCQAPVEKAKRVRGLLTMMATDDCGETL